MNDHQTTPILHHDTPYQLLLSLLVCQDCVLVSQLRAGSIHLGVCVHVRMGVRGNQKVRLDVGKGKAEDKGWREIEK